MFQGIPVSVTAVDPHWRENFVSVVSVVERRSENIADPLALAPATRDCDLVTEVIDSLAALRALEPEWRALQRRVGRPSQVFQSFDWCSAWAEGLGDAREHNLRIVTVRIDGHLALVWPLMRTCVGPLCVLRWLSDPYSQYGDVLVAADAGRDRLLAAAWERIRSLPGVDAIRLRHVRVDAVAACFLARHCRPVGDTDSAPCLDLTAFADEAAYARRYTKAQRRRRKRIRRELEEKGALDFRLLRSGPEFDALIDRTIAEKRHWLAERGLHSRPLADPRLADFIRRLADFEDLDLVLSVLTSGSEPVAFEIGLRFGGHHFGYITAHDTCLTDASPARLHMDLSQRRAIADGLAAFDLMVPGDPHKVSWSCHSVDVFDFCAPVTLAGHLYGLAYLESLRPLARRAYLIAPPAVRRHFKRLVGA